MNVELCRFVKSGWSVRSNENVFSDRPTTEKHIRKKIEEIKTVVLESAWWFWENDFCIAENALSGPFNQKSHEPSSDDIDYLSEGRKSIRLCEEILKRIFHLSQSLSLWLHLLLSLSDHWRNHSKNSAAQSKELKSVGWLEGKIWLNFENGKWISGSSFFYFAEEASVNSRLLCSFRPIDQCSLSCPDNGKWTNCLLYLGEIMRSSNAAQNEILS
jgi:hypothetical protein